MVTLLGICFWQCSPGTELASGLEGSVPWGLAKEEEGSPVFGIWLLSSASQGVGEACINVPSQHPVPPGVAPTAHHPLGSSQGHTGGCPKGNP